MKLRGRTEARALGVEGAQCLSARGAKPGASHGPLQRLLDATVETRFSSRASIPRGESLAIPYERNHSIHQEYAAQDESKAFRTVFEDQAVARKEQSEDY